MNRIMLAVAVFAGMHVCVSSRALAQDTSPPPANTVTRSADDFVDQQIALVGNHIDSMRKQLIAANVTLTDTEATRFWPVYEQYSAQLRRITDTKTALIKEYGDAYGSLTDEQADSLIRRWLDADIATLELRRKYLPIFRKVLGGKTSATFFQVDHRINMLIDLQLTSQLPLAQSQDLTSSSFTREVQ
jgi:Spy/CpxP family protein refolding chaperone